MALAVMLWQSLRDQNDSAGQSVSARGAALSGSLSEWSTRPRISTIGVQLETVPSRAERAWLGALAAAGSRLTWSGDIASTMIDAQAVASPGAGTRITIAAPNGVPVVLGDEVGVIDTVNAQHYGVGVVPGPYTNRLTGSVGGSVASTVLSDSVLLRKVLVIGSASWESKFVVAALEESGWKVDALIRIAPNVEVAQGSAMVIDTARYSAVIALDGASLPYASRIIEFARTGGGVVISPHASRVDALGVLRSATVSRATADFRPALTVSRVDLNLLSLTPLFSLRSDATALERRSGAVASAARRFAGGRALQIGHEDTWRWRMRGDDEAVRSHREWWTGLVSSVAYAPRVAQRVNTDLTDEAPTIGLVAAIGATMPLGRMASLARPTSDWANWGLVLLALGLFGEVASRRRRGEL